MSSALHAFRNYSVQGENEWCEEIVYEDDEDYDISGGNWTYIYNVIGYGSSLLGLNVNLPHYNYQDDVDIVKREGMKLIEPSIFVEILEAAIQSIYQLEEGENPIIPSKIRWSLFDDLKQITYEEQKDDMLRYANKLLGWAKEGLYFVAERE